MTLRVLSVIRACLFAFATVLTACQDKSLFERLDSSRTGITFANTITESDTFNVLDFEYIYNGGGVGIGDVNNDGLPDIFFTGNQVPNRLYLNRGNLHFEDVTKQAGLLSPHHWSTGVSMVDINADGLLDIYVCTINPKRGQPGVPNQFFINEGLDKDGLPRFSDQAAALGLDDRGYSTQAAFFDYDRDGDLDVYLLTNALENYNRNQLRGPVRDGSGKSTDRLYRNMTTERAKPMGQSLAPPLFEDVSRAAGITIEGWGLGVSIADINEDGWPDVYCANDFQSNDLLWINNQDGTFTNRLNEYIRHGSYNAMGIDVADLTNDGHPELMTLDMMPEDNQRQKSMFGAQNVDRYQLSLERGYAHQYVRNVLQLNQGPVVRHKNAPAQITFSEIGQLAGVYATDWSWSTLLADFDNDGFRDIFITNGYPKDITDLDFTAYNNQYHSSYFNTDSRTNEETKQKMQELVGVNKSNVLFRNTGGSLAFEDVTQAWGLQEPSFTNGAAYADLDNDGDLDIVTNNLNGQAFVYQNRSRESSRKGASGQEHTGSVHFLRLNLVGEGGNRMGFGAKVELRYGGRLQFMEQSPARGYVSTVDPTLHFGLGQVTRVDTLLVRWLDGRVSRLTGVAADQMVTVRQADAQPEAVSPATGLPPTVLDELVAGNPVPFVHEENSYVDFKQQVLLPHRYSQNGPGMAVGDVDGNGLDDLFIGGASSFNGSLFQQKSPGQFSKQVLKTPGGERKLAEDMGSVFFDADSDGDQDLYVVSGGNEWPANHKLYQDRLYINDGQGHFRPDTTALPDTRASGSCVVAADYDQDGDLDLFVGGRVVPRQYPLPARSYLLENDKGCFKDVTEQIAPGLAHIGMVTSALWSDYDNDGRIDLLVVGELMPISIWKNSNGQLKAIRTPLQTASGWWNSLIGGDFDNDGDIDYVAGNLGLNSRFRVSETQPLSVYARDYDQNGTLDPILCCYVQGKCYPAHPRDQLAEQVPGLKRRFPTYAAYGQMTVNQLLTPDELQGAYVATATELRSCYIENTGKGLFTLRALPMQAQLAPVFGLLASDFNQDGCLDVLLAGNSYATDTQIGRYDAGKGLLLLGDGRGGFRPETLARSGFCADRDAKSMIRITTGPGQSLVLVSNNADTLQTFRWVNGPRRSLLLRSDEYAAYWKLPHGQRRRVEVYTGSGYLSQSSRLVDITQDTATLTILNYQGHRRLVRLK